MGKKRESAIAKSRVQRVELIQELLKKCTSKSTGLIQKDWEEFLGLYDLIQQIRTLERRLELPNRQEHWSQFKQWCVTNGCSLDKLDIVSTGDGEFGLAATVPLEENEIFLRVPRKIVLSTQQAQRGTLGRLVEADPLLKHMPNVVLALQLLVEREMSGSFWRPYLDILPASYHTVFYFQPEELKILWGSPALEEALNLSKNIARQYAYLYTLFQKTDQFLKDTFTYDSYRWAVSTVMTRQNAVPNPDGESTSLALVPLWDMCNHATGKVCTDFNLETGFLECHAMTPVKPGQEIHIFYGQRSNLNFFLHNGFVHEDNENDVYHLKLGVSQQDKLYPLRRTAVEKHEISLNPTIYPISPLDTLPQDLLKLAAIQTMEKEELSQLTAEGSPLLETDLHHPAMQRGLRFLRDRLQLLSRAYKGNADAAASQRHQLAVQYLNLEKILLNKVIESLSSMLQ